MKIAGSCLEIDPLSFLHLFKHCRENNFNFLTILSVIVQFESLVDLMCTSRILKATIIQKCGNVEYQCY